MNFAFFALFLCIRAWPMAFLAGFLQIGMLERAIPWERCPKTRRLALAVFVTAELSFLVFFVTYVAVGGYLAPAVAAISAFLSVMVAWLFWQRFKLRGDAHRVSSR